MRVLFLAAALWFVAASIARQWPDVRQSLATAHPAWGLVALSTSIVFVAYAVLIQAWRLMLTPWRVTISFWASARIWFISNLGRYVPGKVWQIAAMSALAQEEGVSPVAATGSALIVNLANVLSGVVVVIASGPRLLDVTTHGRSGSAMVLVTVLLAGLLALPAVLPVAMRVTNRLIGRSWTPPMIPHRTIWAAVAGTLVSWVLYGLAFTLLAHALLRPTQGSPLDFIAIYTVSYLAGYLFLPAPGGIGVREWAMVRGLTALGLATPGDAWMLAFGSRLWLTVLEALPGIVWITTGHRRPQPPTLQPDNL